MEKEMIQNYAVENSVNVGGKRFLFCISTDENEPHPYMKCRERRETFLAHYENAIAGNDYLEVMKLYVKDISDAIAELENERIALGVENADCLKPEELIPIGEDDDIRGKVVALHERELIQSHHPYGRTKNDRSNHAQPAKGVACDCQIRGKALRSQR